MKTPPPLEYVESRARFMGLELFCTPATLIPREETELLAKTALRAIRELQKIHPRLVALDVGTGCGNLAVTMAVNTRDVQIMAADLSAAAVEVARRNVEEHGVSDRVRVFCGDLFEPLRGELPECGADLIICNPPYIPSRSLEKMSAEITDHEPLLALEAGTYGIDFIRRLVNESPAILKSGGILAFEIGAGQDKLVSRLFRGKAEYREVDPITDGNVIRVFRAVRA